MSHSIICLDFRISGCFSGLSLVSLLRIAIGSSFTVTNFMCPISSLFGLKTVKSHLLNLPNFTVTFSNLESIYRAVLFCSLGLSASVSSNPSLCRLMAAVTTRSVPEALICKFAHAHPDIHSGRPQFYFVKK